MCNLWTIFDTMGHNGRNMKRKISMDVGDMWEDKVWGDKMKPEDKIESLKKEVCNLICPNDTEAAVDYYLYLNNEMSRMLSENQEETRNQIMKENHRHGNQLPTVASMDPLVPAEDSYHFGFDFEDEEIVKTWSITTYGWKLRQSQQNYSELECTLKERVRDITGLNAKIANLEDSMRHASYEIYDLECDNRQLRSQIFQLEREWHDMCNALFRRAGLARSYSK